MYPGKAFTSSNLEWHRSLSEHSRQDEELKHKSVQALSTVTDPLEKLRLLCLSRGATGIMELGRVFRNMDGDGSKQLNKDAFIQVIKESGIELSHKDAEDLFDKFDTHKSGTICLDEFIVQYRPPMSESRYNIIEQAFRKLDKTGEGVITIDDIRKVYSCTGNHRYLNGDETADAIIAKFLAHFEIKGIKNGKVTLEEFLNYYSGISYSIDNDSYFDLLMRQSYHL